MSQSNETLKDLVHDLEGANQRLAVKAFLVAIQHLDYDTLTGLILGVVESLPLEHQAIVRAAFRPEQSGGDS